MVVLAIILAIIFYFINRNQKIKKKETDPVARAENMKAGIAVIPTYPPLDNRLKRELEYPIKYKNKTISYKQRTGTFVVYYKGDLNIAISDSEEFVKALEMPSKDYKFLYLPLDQNIFPDNPVQE